MKPLLRSLGRFLLLAIAGAQGAVPDLIVSANDGKYLRVDGKDTYPPHAPPDTVAIIDASVYPPRVVATTPVEHTLVGPPRRWPSPPMESW